MRICKARKKILADAIELAASFARSGTDEVPVVAPEVFWNAYKPDAIANGFIAIVVIKLNVPFWNACGYTYPPGRLSPASP